jgi:3-hydroxyisobutyrate dehydrogenase
VHAAQGVLRDVPSAHGYRGGFNAGFMSKDLRLALQLAGTARQPLPMGERAAQLYQQVRGRGWLGLLLLPATCIGDCC